MAPKIAAEKKKEELNTSPPSLRPRKNSLPNTSTPLPETSRKRKSSIQRNQGKGLRKEASLLKP